MIIDSLADSVHDTLFPTSSGLGGLIGDVTTRFVYRAIFHNEGDNRVGVQFNLDADTTDEVGFSVEVNDVPVIISGSVHVTPNLVQLNIPQFNLGDVIRVSYDGAGNTVHDGIQLSAFTDMKSNPTTQGEYAWGCVGSIYMLSDGAQNSEEFHHEAHAQYIGSGTPQIVTPDGLALPDFEGIYHQSKANEPPYYGWRRVDEKSTYSEDFTNSIWVGLSAAGLNVEYGITDPDGGTTAIRITTLDTGLYNIENLTDIDGFDGAEYAQSIWVREVSPPTGAGIIQLKAAGISTSIHNQVTTIWGRYSQIDPNSLFKGYFGVRLRFEAGISYEIAFANYENVTAQSNQAPSMYIPTTTAPVTRFYSNYNGRSVTNNVVDDSILGSPLPIAPSFYAAPEMRNEIPYSRDLTGAGTLGSPIVAYDEVGMTGEPNSASSIIASSNPAGDGVLQQSFATASPACTVRLRIKKDAVTATAKVDVMLLSGTPIDDRATFNFHTDTGAVDTSTAPILAPVVESDGDVWVVYVELQTDGTHTNAQVRLYGRLSPDKIVYEQAEWFAGKTIDQVRGSAPIFTSGAAVTQAAIQLPYDIANHSQERGAYYCEWTPFYDSSVVFGLQQKIIDFSDSASGGLYNNTQADLLTFRPSAGTHLSKTWDEGDTVKIGAVYESGNDQDLNADGVWQGGRAYTEAGLGTHLNLITPVDAPVLIRNVRRYNLPYADAKAKIDELMTPDPLAELSLGVGWSQIGLDSYQFDVPNGVNFVAATFVNVIVGNNYRISFQASGDLPATALLFKPGNFTEDVVIEPGGHSIDFLAQDSNGTTRFAVQDISGVTQFRISSLRITPLP